MSLIAAYLNQSVQIAARSGHNSNGQATYSAAATARARVQMRKRLIRNESGEQVVSDMQVFLGPTTTIAEGDRITYAGVTYVVLSVTTEQGLDSVSHLVAWTGRSGGAD